MKISVQNYIDIMEKKNYFFPDATVAEFNILVWRLFLEYTAKDVPTINDSPIYFVNDKYGFFHNPFGDFEALEWALCSYFCHSHIPFIGADLVQDAPAILSELQDELQNVFVKTDTFISQSIIDKTYEKYFLWLNSPVISLSATFKEYVTSLTSSRRNKIKKVLQQYDKNAITTNLSFTPLTTDEIDFVYQNLTLKWRENMPYALAQFFWSQSTAKIIPHQIYWLRVYDKGKLLAISHYVIKENILYHQGIIKDENQNMNNIGTFCFLATIEWLCGSTYSQIDPTCKTGFIESESIEFYKRSVVNTNATKPIYVLYNKKMHELVNPIIPSYSNDGWQIPMDKHIEFLGL